MSSNASPEWVDPGEGRCGSPDPARRIVHVALALYLSPVVAIVCVIGLASIVFDKASRAAGRLASGRVRSGGADPLTAALAKSEAMRPLPPRDRRKLRV